MSIDISCLFRTTCVGHSQLTTNVVIDNICVVMRHKSRQMAKPRVWNKFKEKYLNFCRTFLPSWIWRLALWRSVAFLKLVCVTKVRFVRSADPTEQNEQCEQLTKTYTVSMSTLEADRISATASVTAPKLPLKWLSARFRFRPSWFRPNFRYGCKWNLVSACRRRSIALLSRPSLKWLRLCNMTAVLSSVRQWPYTEHVTAHFYPV